MSHSFIESFSYSLLKALHETKSRENLFQESLVKAANHYSRFNLMSHCFADMLKRAFRKSLFFFISMTFAEKGKKNVQI